MNICRIIKDHENAMVRVGLRQPRTKLGVGGKRALTQGVELIKQTHRNQTLNAIVGNLGALGAW